ncbi:alkene reductase [Actinorhabdospora filicis]|uniref:Alkene reductase n=1 Tax=Actinorhabdospora filicis TaxID=1785913 RepID=A0A9W6SIT5_9ACTN|nr:alkene reductase [Actinorhabdospora filicis]GLZ76740.1 alkene reductase [Actinorhabdospora filicis]
MSRLFTPAEIGGLALPNRLVMAPLTRTRADADGTPNALMTEYYAQRATAGLIVAEATTPSLIGRTHPGIPGVHTPAHVEGWRRLTGAVGGRMFLQLQHGGRVRHHGSTEPGVAPSPVPLKDMVPRELTGAGITAIIAEFARAARNAVAAGFDGVEVHAANGYLLHQFTAPNTNLRADEWADPVRFTVEVTRAVVDAVGAGRVGVRVSPRNRVNGIEEGAATGAIYAALVPALRELGPAYLHVVRVPAGDPVFARIRRDWTGVLIANPDLGKALPADGGLAAAEGLLDEGADLIALGRAFIANPDLVERLREGLPLNPLREEFMYEGAAEGYTDYPKWAQAPVETPPASTVEAPAGP